MCIMIIASLVQFRLGHSILAPKCLASASTPVSYCQVQALDKTAFHNAFSHHFSAFSHRFRMVQNVARGKSVLNWAQNESGKQTD